MVHGLDRLPEDFADRTHAHDDVQVGLDAVKQEVVDGLAVLFDPVLFGLFFQVVFDLKTSNQRYKIEAGGRPGKRSPPLTSSSSSFL